LIHLKAPKRQPVQDGGMTHSATPPRALLTLAEAKVPRYTSYPIAAQFGPLEEAQYRAWLAQGIGAADPLSLYLHVPFCGDLGWYCAWHTKPTRRRWWPRWRCWRPPCQRMRAYLTCILAVGRRQSWGPPACGS
jgi:hypothetical protein